MGLESWCLAMFVSRDLKALKEKRRIDRRGGQALWADAALNYFIGWTWDYEKGQSQQLSSNWRRLASRPCNFARLQCTCHKFSIIVDSECK
jgi:hypothetical protein